MIEIVLLGHRKRAGKDTLATELCKREGFKRVAYADKLKEVVADLFRFTPEQIDGPLKEVVDERYGFTPRHAFQKIGTEYLRTLYPKIWTDYVFYTTIPALITWGHKKIVITDLRFPNEHSEALSEKILKHLSILDNIHTNEIPRVTAVRVDRSALPPLNPEDHISETALGDYDKWDFEVSNDGTPENLYEQFISKYRN